MQVAPTVVGINRTQDASIAVARGDGYVLSLQKERLSRRKHHWGRLGDVPNLYVPALADLARPVDLVVECWSSDEQVRLRTAYHEELAGNLRLAPGARVLAVSHHLAHAYSAFFPSPFAAAAVMVIDAQGSAVADVVEPFPGRDGGDGTLLEVASFYDATRDGALRCLGKQLWDGDWARPTGLGCFYYLLTRAIFPSGEGNEGKVMGLAPFGDPDALALPDLDVDGFTVTIPEAWVERLREPGAHLFPASREAPIAASANLAAAGQRAFERALLRVAGWLAGATGRDAVCFAGGAALNCSANGRLLREGTFADIFIPPSPHDGGTAVGCALYGLIEALGERSAFRWRDDYLGPPHDEGDVVAALRDTAGELVVERPRDLLGAIVELLAAGGVVAVHHGRSESGPRALGNRSILADARRPAMRDHINFNIKGREWFRPLAPVVLAEAAGDYFAIDRPAPFMQFATDVHPEHRDALPAITHVDGSARIQTVDGGTAFLRALLEQFAGATGCAVLLNTSLNGPGDPLTETPADALATFRATPMHALALPPYLVRKRDEPRPVPLR